MGQARQGKGGEEGGERGGGGLQVLNLITADERKCHCSTFDRNFISPHTHIHNQHILSWGSGLSFSYRLSVQIDLQPPIK